MFTNKKREGVNTCVCAVSLYVAETNKVSIEVHETTLPIIPFSIVALSLLDNLSRNSCIKKCRLGASRPQPRSQGFSLGEGEKPWERDDSLFAIQSSVRPGCREGSGL